MFADLAMGCKSSAKGERVGNKGNGTKGKGKGSGGGGGGTGSGSFQVSKFEKQMSSFNMKLLEQDKANAKILALLGAKTSPPAAAAAAAAGCGLAGKPHLAGSKEPFWTCGSCGDLRCFANRAACHKCSTPRAAAAAVAAAPAALEDPPGLSEMELDIAALTVVSLDEQILIVEAEVKQLKPPPGRRFTRRRPWQLCS